MKAGGNELEERASSFAEIIIDFCRSLPLDAVNDSLVRQLVRSTTSVGANYCEADEAESKKDFRHKIALCRKNRERPNTGLRMIARASPAPASPSRALWREAKELHLIFAPSSARRTKT